MKASIENLDEDELFEKVPDYQEHKAFVNRKRDSFDLVEETEKPSIKNCGKSSMSTAKSSLGSHHFGDKLAAIGEHQMDL